jgi:hypothetical protein
MREFKVISDNINVGGKTYPKGSKIKEQMFRPGVADVLVGRGKLEDVTSWNVPIEGKIKLAIVTSVWKRPEIVDLFMQGIHKLKAECIDFEITLVMSGSIQDDENIDKKGYVLKEFLDGVYPNFKYIEIPNEPLAAKVNATTYACKNLNVHYVMCMGSDDIMSPELLNAYIPYMRKGIDFIGVTDGYFYDTVSKRSLYWGGYREPYRKGHTLGAFRALSARLLSKWDWMPWENKDSHVLDKSMQDKLKVTPHTFESFSMKEKNVIGIDIKSSTNMTPFAKWDNSEFIDTEIIKTHFPYVCD